MLFNSKKIMAAAVLIASMQLVSSGPSFAETAAGETAKGVSVLVNTASECKTVQISENESKRFFNSDEDGLYMYSTSNNNTARLSASKGAIFEIASKSIKILRGRFHLTAPAGTHILMEQLSINVPHDTELNLVATNSSKMIQVCSGRNSIEVHSGSEVFSLTQGQEFSASIEEFLEQAISDADTDDQDSHGGKGELELTMIP